MSRPTPELGSLALVHTEPAVDVPVQYFQSVIAIELAVAGALLWQIRFFESATRRRAMARTFPTPGFDSALPSS
jgi:hypothetical protein